MDKLNFELGQWVSTEDGYGQIIYVRAFFVENYENNRKETKNGDFKRYLFICKILCNFSGKLKTSNRIKVYSSISPIDKEGKVLIQKIKSNQNLEYIKYILYDEKNVLSHQLFVNYKLNELDFNVDLVQVQFSEISSRLFPSFTYSDFSKVFKEYDLPFQLDNIIGYGESNLNSITVRFDSDLYKTKDKEIIFNDLTIFFPQNLLSKLTKEQS